MNIDRSQDMFRTSKMVQWNCSCHQAWLPEFSPWNTCDKIKTWILHVFWLPHACCSRHAHAHTTIHTHNNNKNLKTLLGRYTWWLCPKLYQLFCLHSFQVSMKKVCDTIVLVSFFLQGKDPELRFPEFYFMGSEHASIISLKGRHCLPRLSSRQLPWKHCPQRSFLLPKH